MKDRNIQYLKNEWVKSPLIYFGRYSDGTNVFSRLNNISLLSFLIFRLMDSKKRTQKIGIKHKNIIAI
jgi:hypothetical protein